MKRDKNRIHPFCEELTRLWEQKPHLRFGQIVSALPYYVEGSHRDLFYLEEDEMLETLRRFFQDNYKDAEQSESERYSRLTDQWEELANRLMEEDTLEIEKFRPLFAETWQYLITSTAGCCGGGLWPADLAILSRLAVLVYYCSYPQSILPWEFEACQKIAGGLLQSLQDPIRPRHRGNFFDGIIVVTEYHRVDIEVHISEFDSYLNKLAKDYYEDHFSEDYDENGIPWEA